MTAHSTRPNYKFTSPEHEKDYNDAKALLIQPDMAQEREALAILRLIDRLPEPERIKKIAQLNQNWREARAPLIQIMGQLLAYASPIVYLPEPLPAPVKKE